MVDPTVPGVEFWFPNISRLVYAGDGLFSGDEDVYNRHCDTARVIGEWLPPAVSCSAIPSR